MLLSLFEVGLDSILAWLLVTRLFGGIPCSFACSWVRIVLLFTSRDGFFRFTAPTEVS